MRRALLAALLAAAAPIGAATAQQPTIQQGFDAASAALAAGDWAEALRLFEALEARVRDPRSLTIIGTRKAGALFELNRVEEAAALLRTAVPALPADDNSLDSDRFVAC